MVFGWFKKKEKKKVPKDNRKFRELYARLNYLIRNEGKNKSEAQLEILEELVKEVEVDRKKMIDNYEQDRQEWQEQEKQRHINFLHQVKEADKVKNQLWLMLDICKRELEIMKLNKGLSLLAMPDERQVILDKISELNKINGEIEKTLRSKEIDADMLKDIKERLSLDNDSKE
jgi:hypothetical protein